MNIPTKITILSLTFIYLIGCESKHKFDSSAINKNKFENIESSIKENSQSQQPNKSSSENFLSYIDSVNEIEISHTDNKYGEWGGDTDMILIFSDEYGLLIIGITITSIVGFVSFGLYSMEIEDHYGDLQEFFYASKDGDLILKQNGHYVGI